MDKEKKTMIVWTTTAALLVEAALVITSLTPLARIGNGTRFGSGGMWINLIWCGSCYFLPLIVYCMDVRAMKYVLAVYNAVWLIALPILLVMAVGGQWEYLRRDGRIYSSLLLMAFVCLIGLIVQVIWYPMCLRRQKPR